MISARVLKLIDESLCFLQTAWSGELHVASVILYYSYYAMQFLQLSKLIQIRAVFPFL